MEGFIFSIFKGIFAYKSKKSLGEEILVVATDEKYSAKAVVERGGEAWFALYTMPRTERKVKERLEKRGFKVYLPEVTTMRQWSDRKKKVQLPLIPSIVFIHVDLASLTLALQCEGVVRVIRFLQRPARIRESEINNLRVLLREPNSVIVRDEFNYLEEGVSVRVVRGPFLGVVGKCIRLQGKHSLVVEIEALRRQIELTIPVSFIETERIRPMEALPVAV